MERFDTEIFHSICDQLADRDDALRGIRDKHGYPPMWSRPASFSSLIHIMLEQQVSLASALAAFNRLKEKVGDITPESILSLTDEELRACYFSRQKAGYARNLAEAITSGRLNLGELGLRSDDEVRQALKQVKGIGDWTADIYLIFTLQRADIFPVGDLAMVNAFRKVKGLLPSASREEITAMAEHWRPFRSVATMLLWHYYLEERVKRPGNLSVTGST